MTFLDLEQNTLFGEKVIKTISYNEQEIIRDILCLHANGRMIDVDPCFSVGNFYKHGIPAPEHRFDKTPAAPGVIKATSDNLPLGPESVNVVMFDPPFVISGQGYDGTDDCTGLISSRFTSFKTFDELKTMYSGSLKEFSRILMGGGIVIFKCQDGVACGKNHFIHSWVMYEAMKHGFYPKDLFILLARNRINDGRKQQHARKYHSYFWVLQKMECKVNYETIRPGSEI